MDSSLLLIAVAAIVLMYVFTMLPQKKRMEQQKKLLDSLQPGVRVMLNTGMFGTLRAVGENQMVVELAPGVEVTVLKQAVIKAVEPDDEEFEYAEDASAGESEDTDELTDEASVSVNDPVDSVGQTAEATPADDGDQAEGLDLGRGDDFGNNDTKSF